MESAGNPFRSAFTGGFWEGGVARAYGVRAIPRAWLLGPDGRVLQREVYVPMLLGETEGGDR